MKKFLKVTAIVVGVLVVIVFGGGLLISPKWEVARSRVIPAPPAAIHAYVGDFAKWPVWSPFEKEDPNMVITIETPSSSGVGARRSWKIEPMGNGSQSIVKSDPERGTAFVLAMEDFTPFDVEFVYEPVAGGTKVTWSDRGEMGWNPIHRWFGTMMEPMMGPTFEKGLADLEAAVVAKR